MTLDFKNWKNDPVRIIRSRGGKIAFIDYRDNLLIPKNVIWPHPDIVKKLYKSNRINAFFEKDIPRLRKVLGFYCDLQSMRSEDAITWSVFGTLNFFDSSIKTRFLNSLLKGIGEEANNNKCTLQLWSRVAHPDTLVSGGPELDFQFLGDSTVIFGESKWRSKISRRQGKSKKKDQIQLRKEYLSKYGAKIFPTSENRFVLLIGREKDMNTEDEVNYLSWDTVCTSLDHPLGDELAQYYKWKMKYG